jgi:A/G-specific adenine glycosylase
MPSVASASAASEAPAAAAAPAAVAVAIDAPAFAERLMAWQAQHGRHHLPWQGTRDPYRVWLSEIMLQQTQVAAVLGYYPRFLQRFPDVQALAAAPLDDVLAAWSGLGYYRRARNLHACAQQVVHQWGGRFPSRSGELARLPGIGASTAAAIAAFCHGERAAILDGNVKRVLARWLAFEDDVSTAAGHRDLLGHAQALLPGHGMAAYTQGLMDLGATVCLPRAPACERCPVAPDCRARQQASPLHYPVQQRRVARGRRESVWLWLRHGDRLWLQRRPEQGVWAGLWSLPEFDSFEALAAASRGWPGAGEALATLVHPLTHFDWTLHPRRWTWPCEAGLPDLEDWAQPGAWFEPQQALAKGLPAPLRRLLSSVA